MFLEGWALQNEELTRNLENLLRRTLIKSVVTMEDVPQDLIIHWDQTAMKIVPSSAWMMEKKGTKRVEIVATDDKRRITAEFACSLSLVLFLTNAINLPRDNSEMFSQRCYDCIFNHWSNTATMVDYLKHVIN